MNNNSNSSNRITRYVENINPGIAAAAVFFLFFILPFLTMRSGTMEGDMAEYLNNPLRVIHGDLPYRDFWLLFSPGEVLFPAMIYALFGVNINMVLVFSIFFSSICGLLTFKVGRQLTGSTVYAIILSFMVYYDGSIRYYCGPAYDHLDFLFLLIAILFYLKYLGSPKALYLFLTGISVGMAFFFRLYEVGPAAVAFIISICFNSRDNKKPLARTAREIMFYLSGIVLTIIIITLLLFDIWKPMFFAVVFDSVSHGTSMKIPFWHECIEAFNRVRESYLAAGRSGHFPVNGSVVYGIIVLVKDILAYLTPFLVIISAFWFLLKKKFIKRELTVLILFLTWGIFSLPKAFGRSDLMHLATATTPLFFVVVMLIRKSMRQDKSLRNPMFKFISATLITLCCFSLLSFPAQLKNYYDFYKNYRYEVRSGSGRLYFNTAEDADNANKVISYIKANTGSNDYIFVTYWYAPPLYALTNRKNPSFYDSLIDVVARPSESKQNSICDDLTRKHTKLIIHNRDWGFDDKADLQFSYACPVLQKFIDANYKMVEHFGKYEIYAPR